MLVLCALLGFLYSTAWGAGSYALAPGGTYTDWTFQGISHDWHQYRWFFQEQLFEWPLLAVFGLFAGVFTALFVVPVICALGTLLLWVTPAIKQRLSSVNRARLYYVTILLGLITGVVQTIINGRNPGMP